MKPKAMKPQIAFALVVSGRLALHDYKCEVYWLRKVAENHKQVGERIQRVLITPVPLPGRKGGQTNGK
jgi:hypothetical protein